ncbi:nucleoside triphosphate pyrophosphohydrolase [Sphingorhabdus sp. Alg239-R122]|uniref:nucleoside triphosphate pyrophosphohydrolase n=1 Tax=Sphingorhabdus sp. Alg239-R122 TaxID=2305989 RepID=UPI0013DB7FF0|nr:nucleoside triphosphate pyrophosphohydrolase [Sphingorhabdus sp. Alg239-R122]
MIDPLVKIMAQLRDPENGCPWDIEQDFKSIAPYTVEEAYEVSDAIDRGDMDDLKDELGDLLLQVVFHSQMAKEAGFFTIDDVASAICDKMTRRHPHIFADTAAENWDWEKLKEEERNDSGQSSAMDGVAHTLPALMRAQKLQKRAKRTGFDWDEVDECIAKLEEEIAELKNAKSVAEKHEESGDLLFAAVNVVRHYSVDAEIALKDGNNKFENRFRMMEKIAGEAFEDLPLQTKEELWQRVKSAS